VLLGYLLGRDAAYLIAHSDDPLTSEQHASYRKLVARRAAGEPVAYLTGEREFFGHRFRVSPAVLIPRPETEGLVEWALEHVAADRAVDVLDLGTGSGCIAISIALARPRARVHGVDRAPQALALARENAATLGASNVRLSSSDWFSALAGETFDTIVANPPYVATGDPHLTEGDLRFEPGCALSAGVDGLDAIRQIVAEAPAHLAADGWMLVEHGFDQADAVRGLMQAAGFTAISSAKDLAGIERVTAGRLTSSEARQ
jgi:release factor glutamine methyltransferase